MTDTPAQPSEFRASFLASVARRIARIVGLLMVAAGTLCLTWALVVWLWQDPFTAIYTRIQQHKLASQYEQLVNRYVAPSARPGITVAQERRLIARDARRYRLATHEGEAIGRIHVPALGLSMILVDGTDHNSLTKGPGRDLRTFMPGEHQLVYIAGHRTTYLAPFAHIDRLESGETVTIEMPYATFVYRVTGHRIVPATELSQLRSHRREVVALQACHPRFFATQRYIVYATPVRVLPRHLRAYTVS